MSGRKKDPRVGALARFAIAISALNVVGHIWLGFEQPWSHPLIALVTAYCAELVLETLDAWGHQRAPRFAGGFKSLVVFLLPAHISALAVSMLLYANQRLAPIAFAAGAAIISKYLFRVKVGGRPRHFFNPSNLGITLTLAAFPSVGIGMAYMFTENVQGWGNWALPALIVVTGSLLNTLYTKKMPLIAGWLGGFVLQAVVRSVMFDTPLTAALLPMSGVAFILFTFYMVSDPSTTPRSVPGQLAFGGSVAAVYGLLLAGHIVFTLFIALSLVCLARGVGLAVQGVLASREALAPSPVPIESPGSAVSSSGG